MAETSAARWMLGIAAAVIVAILVAVLTMVSAKADATQVDENRRRINSTEVAVGRVETKLDFLLERVNDNSVLLREIRNGSK